ncbi:MAG: ABC transporter permease [Planctomycetota bacterium]|nr:ABC transporter permease [Planctomycetota bacterium]
MRAIDRKLLRDLWEMRGQVLAIGLVIVSGVATFVMSLSTLDSLQLTRATFYRDYRFSDVFASLKRAPEGLVQRIRALPGVDQVEVRVVADVSLDLDGFPDPVSGHLVSIPEPDAVPLNRLYLRSGRLVDPSRDDEVILGEAFAEAHDFRPGDEIVAIINGRRKRLRIVGVALSPEFIYQIRPGALIPDFEHYGLLWMAQHPLSIAYDMDGAFNDVVLTLTADARLEDVIERLDGLLEPYGGRGAYGRQDQLSHRFLNEEFRSIEAMATVLPAIFLSVAAFLLNVVLSRLITTQREQIAVLKAFGYTNVAVGVHYLKMVLAISLVGVAGGIAAGVWIGQALSELYSEFYRFPFLRYELRPQVAITAGLISTAAAVLGTFSSVRRAARLPPAQAMRPEPPASFRESMIERLGFKRFFAQPGRMVIRHIGRRPVQALLTVTGLSFACAIMVVGRFQMDAIDFMVNVQFGLAQREDLSVTFVEPTSGRALHELRSLVGVHYGEPFRSAPSRLRFGHRSYRTAVTGVRPGGDLHRLLDASLRSIELPPEGIVLNEHLGQMLGVRPGDRLTVEVLEGARPVVEVPVVALVRQYMGVVAYMELGALNRLLREGHVISGAYLAVDSRHRGEVYSALKEMPRVAGVEVRQHAIRNFYETIGETMSIFTFINSLLAGSIAFGVVYNSARIALSERARDLASLRVLGYTRGEISSILLGELAVYVLAAIPLGFFVGRTLAAYFVSHLQSDLFRVPLVVEPRTYAFAALVVLVSAGISALIVRRRLDQLDLVAVLKTKE